MQTTCGGCGAPIEAIGSSYSESGVLLCADCEAKEITRVGDGRAADAIYGAALSALAFGSLSICCNPFLLPSIAAFSAAAGALFAIARHPEYRNTLGQSKWVASIVCAVLGLLLGTVRLLLAVLTILVATG